MASAAHMSHEVVPDALPYIDQGYEETEIREMVNQLIEEETRRYRPTKNYLEFLPTPNFAAFETSIMKTEFERIASHLPMELLSMKRYELPHPPAAQKTDLNAWNECVNNSASQLEHQALRISNLELLATYGTEAWKSNSTVLQAMLSDQQQNLVELRKRIQEINWLRKSEQTKAGEELHRLESMWIGLVNKNYEIERVCVSFEAELQEKLSQKTTAEAKEIVEKEESQ